MSFLVALVQPAKSGEFVVYGGLSEPSADVPVGASLRRPDSPTVYTVSRLLPRPEGKRARPEIRGFLIDSSDRSDPPKLGDYLTLELP